MSGPTEMELLVASALANHHNEKLRNAVPHAALWYVEEARAVLSALQGAGMLRTEGFIEVCSVCKNAFGGEGQTICCQKPTWATCPLAPPAKSA